MENLKLEVQAYIKFLVKIGWISTAIIEPLQKVYGDKTPSRAKDGSKLKVGSSGVDNKVLLIIRIIENVI
uniref:Uncharacterized protein n=1 Tax=Romanomermis culicivorax TaxID=13658 RepID=A0A915KLQ3_ROMCU